MTKHICDKCGTEGEILGLVEITRVMCGPGPHVRLEWCDRCIETLMRDLGRGYDPASLASRYNKKRKVA